MFFLLLLLFFFCEAPCTPTQGGRWGAPEIFVIIIIIIIIWLKKVEKFRPGDMEESYFLRILARTVTLIVKIGIQTNQVMMLHHHSKFGCIQFSGSEDIFQTKV